MRRGQLFFRHVLFSIDCKLINHRRHKEIFWSWKALKGWKSVYKPGLRVPEKLVDVPWCFAVLLWSRLLRDNYTPHSTLVDFLLDRISWNKFTNRLLYLILNRFFDAMKAKVLYQNCCYKQNIVGEILSNCSRLPFRFGIHPLNMTFRYVELDRAFDA